MKNHFFLITTACCLFGKGSAAEGSSYIFFSAPSINENYYKPKFDELIDFYKGFVSRADPGDKAVIVADAQTIVAIGNRIPGAT